MQERPWTLPGQPHPVGADRGVAATSLLCPDGMRKGRRLSGNVSSYEGSKKQPLLSRQGPVGLCNEGLGDDAIVRISELLNNCHAPSLPDSHVGLTWLG